MRYILFNVIYGKFCSHGLRKSEVFLRTAFEEDIKVHILIKIQKYGTKIKCHVNFSCFSRARMSNCPIEEPLNVDTGHKLGERRGVCLIRKRKAGAVNLSNKL